MKLVICGGGISGISAAFYARKLFKNACEIILIEKSSRVGGWMDTNVANGNRKEYRGPINEKGPRSVRAGTVAGKCALSFVSEFGFFDEIVPVTATDVSAQNRMLYVNERLHQLPNSLLSAIQTKPPFSKSLASIILPGLFKTIPKDLETVEEIMEARFGKEFSDIAAGSLCRGVFAADYKELSFKAAFTTMWPGLGNRDPEDAPRKPTLDMERDSNSLKPETLMQLATTVNWSQWTSKKGFSHLLENMAGKLENEMRVEIIRNCEVESLVRETDGSFSIEMNQGNGTEVIENVDHVISAIPSHSLSTILSQSKNNSKSTEEDKHIYSDLTRNLDEIKWVDVALANVEFAGLPKENLPYLGFGHLVPPCEPSDILGVVYDSCAYPQHDRLGSESTRLTCMMGGSWFEEVFGTDENIPNSKIEQVALDGLDEQLDLYEDPVEINSHVCRKCIPLYRRGHTDVVEDLEDLIDDHDLELSLVGASYWGVSISDCIMNSKIAVEEICERHLPQS